ncbi:acetyl/propionyl/methylcrotonyl-CoA carboxylase subunit alpha [Moritella viscosa]|uniref:Biotin carboxylase n=2 Tax=Moritella viscosa TaxID=80854 RepID=A0A1K9Z6W8_9GAMM|nr:acetyl/propionyl/methylcrotonyl-CoA carboxylase subunit alpha [Moritella viscosa]SGY92052.1 3-methylcrotonoyl-CoA carboxylase, alpha subunit [Moritella viscosa]SHO02083.1 3-methylcrotonoyl-CoA carboxylase, alpha subunit [Moritella viscosa]SHO02256.1 3-methylcrotonoyl-CoA carboxylase, alpha subunit [Moritella viscosa]SHO04291.1 3-methylcrotonoyl-CoA carboxylase, alpha subunit [Moritella viscosa]SHO06754.1 3-methylcrotonoyl-CoA carboxylase, alpha subunit [Moritella viscosa]
MPQHVFAKQSKPFTKILIANRGEIACRIIKTAQRLGIKCIAIYSAADTNSRHVNMADEAFYLGPAPATESYLNCSRILEIAAESDVQAIHPGYGFLSENANFAQACTQQGLIFIGPSVDAITTMGSKSAAKTIMETAHVPLIPGYHGHCQAELTLRHHSQKIGYPQLLKAVYGGGGKGMRIIHHASEFTHAIAATKRESMASFGNDDMLIERYLTKTRHVEIQIFSDHHGNCIYLSQRDCSIQRRHQKILEEAPAPALPFATQIAMGEAAVAAAKAINYHGAGTVEFLYDEQDHFYFMEMNTRLQVEHPVTEMITGLDLVEWQLHIANGAPLPLNQNQVHINGHAIEVRIYAEDPDKDFMPASGNIEFLSQPVASKHVRIDTGVIQGDEISPYYDPMIAKLIVWDHNRDLALQRLQAALADYKIAGIKTNIGFLTQLIQVPALQTANLNTDFIVTHAEALKPTTVNLNYALILAGLALQLNQGSQHVITHTVSNDTHSPWSQTTNWRLNQPAIKKFTLTTTNNGDHHYTLTLTTLAQSFQVTVSGQNQVSSDNLVSGQLNRNELTACIDGHRIKATIAISPLHITVFYAGSSIVLLRQSPIESTVQNKAFRSSIEEGLETKITAPMNGVIVSVLCQPDQVVEAGEPLVVMEAMKMECNINAPVAGTVTTVFYQNGDMVEDGAQLIQLTPSLTLDNKEHA